jgi:hypothetical protein
MLRFLLLIVTRTNTTNRFRSPGQATYYVLQSDKYHLTPSSSRFLIEISINQTSLWLLHSALVCVNPGTVTGNNDVKRVPEWLSRYKNSLQSGKWENHGSSPVVGPTQLPDQRVLGFFVEVKGAAV